MKSIQQLHDTADKARQKAVAFRNEAEKQRLKAQDNIDNPSIAMSASNEAQKLEEKASQHDQEAARIMQETTALEAKALELNRRKNEIQSSTQAEIDRLDREEKTLRGDARGMF